MKTIKTNPNILRRISAGLIDYGIFYLFLIGLASQLDELNNDIFFDINISALLILIVFWLIITVGLESGLGGTIGNSLVGLKAIPSDGTNRKLNLMESLKRHLLDPFDMFPFGLIGILTIKNSEQHQRLGDQWAKTIVISIKTISELKTE